MSALSDQTWLLLGASGGIGGALLDRLLDAGATEVDHQRVLGRPGAGDSSHFGFERRQSW